MTDASDLAPRNRDWMNKYHGHSEVALFPSTTEQVSRILQHCNSRRLAVVPQGGNTGLVGGSVPVFDEIIVSTARMNKLLGFDKVSGVAQCQAGLVLDQLAELLHPEGFTVPLDLGAKGRCACAYKSRRMLRNVTDLLRSYARTKLPHWRQCIDQCRRHSVAAIRLVAWLGAWPRGRAARRPRSRLDDSASQGQHGLRPEAAVHRLRGHVGPRDWRLDSRRTEAQGTALDEAWLPLLLTPTCMRTECRASTCASLVAAATSECSSCSSMPSKTWARFYRVRGAPHCDCATRH